MDMSEGATTKAAPTAIQSAYDWIEDEMKAAVEAGDPVAHGLERALEILHEVAPDEVPYEIPEGATA